MTFVQFTITDSLSHSGNAAKLVTIQGQLDESNVDENAKLIYDLLDKNKAGVNLIFDFSGLEYMNSKSIGYLTDWYGKLNGLGCKVVISGCRENILDILQVVGLTQLIPCVATLDEAKAQI